MDNESNSFITTNIKEWREGARLLERLFSLAEPGGVFGEPVTTGERTVITASEITVGMGFGYGVGSGEDEKGEGGSGAGGGGGGGAFGRPVAAIIVDQHGARVEPVVDVTKIALAFFTMMGSLLLMLSKMSRAARG